VSDARSVHVAIEERPGYLIATASGERTAENARSFMVQAFGACMQANRPMLMMVMNLEGPPLDRGAIFSVISGGAPDGIRLRRIAYVDPMAVDPAGPMFATDVAANRGVNVRLFWKVEEAERWLEEP
jgi:hypothetical protein